MYEDIFDLAYLLYFKYAMYIVVSFLSFITFLVIKKLTRYDNSIGFFHPYANDGGGGERVLWFAVKSIQTKYPEYLIYIFTGDQITVQQMIANVKKKFGMDIKVKGVRIVNLRMRKLVESQCYPYFTLLGQSIGSIFLGLEAVSKYQPFIMFDTSGYAFAYPIFKLVCPFVFAYVHYPIISSDMINRIRKNQIDYNNAAFIARHPVLTQAKIVYYRIFMALYGWVGRSATLVFVNSSWTYGHITKVWKMSHTKNIQILYPPCDVETFSKASNTAEKSLENVKNLENTESTISILSISQFRPEKDHRKQLQSFAALLKRFKSDHDKYTNETALVDRLRLVLIGSCRHEVDACRIQALRDLAAELNITSQVDFVINIPFPQILSLASQALIGIHTMYDEHFGISIVESMAAGMIVVANNSGGPKMDILVPYNGKKVGFLAQTPQEYAETMYHIICEMNPNERNMIRESALQSVKVKFSNDIFQQELMESVTPYLVEGLDKTSKKSK